MKWNLPLRSLQCIPIVLEMWAVLYCTFSLAAAGLGEAQIHGTPPEYNNPSNFSSRSGNVSSTSYNTSSSFHSSYATNTTFHLSTTVWRNGSTTAASASSLPTNETIPNTSLNSSAKAVITPPYPVNITRVSLNGTGIQSDASFLANDSSSSRNITTTPPAVLPTPTFYPNTTINGTKNACQASYESYENAYWWWVPTTQLQWTSVLTYDYEYVTYSTELYECTSTCGSICYAGNVTTVRSTSHFYSVRTATFADNPPFPTPLPNCTIPFDECISIQSSYTSASSSWEAGAVTRDWWGTEFEPARPYCSACSSTACTFNGMFAMSLYYWPPTTPITRDYCATAPAGGWASTYIPDYNHTYIPKTTGPSTVVNNITMYDGNVYISYWEPQVHDNCGASVSRQNPENKNRVITVASDALFSIRSYPHILAPWPVTWDLKPYPVNFADFDEPVPWSAYNGQMDCAQPGAPAWKCEAVKPDNYFPYVMMPPQIRDLDPAWASCKFDEYAAFDPPIALRPANMFSSSVVLATPTRDGGSNPQQTPATPGDNGGGWIPVMTPKPTKPQNPGMEDGIIQPPVAQPPVNQIPNAPNPTSGPGANVPIDLPFEGITVGPSVMPVDPSGNLIVQSGMVVRPGEPPVIFDGTTMSMGSSGIVVIDQQGTSTLPLPATQPPQRFLTIGTSTLPLDAAGDLIVKPGITLRMRGNALNIEGTTMSLGLNGLTLFAQHGVSTIPLPAFTPPQSVVTIGGSTFALDKNGGIVLRPNQVLQPGGTALTISGTTYKINAAALTVIDSTGTKVVSFTAAPRQYITVGSQVYTLVNGELILGPKLTLLGPGGMAIFQGTTVKLQSESVVVESQGSKSTVSIKSKMLGSKTQTASTGVSKKNGAKNLGVGVSWVWFFVLGLVHMVYS